MNFFLQCMTFITLFTIALSGPAFSKNSSWETLNDNTTRFYKDQKFMKAASAGRSALDLAKSLPEPDEEKVAISLGNLAMIYTHLGKFAEAEAHAKEELLTRQKIYGKENIEVLKAWNHLAIVYTMAQAPVDAEASLKKIIELEEKKYGRKSREVFASLKKLEKFYQITRNQEKEKELSQRIKELESAGI